MGTWLWRRVPPRIIASMLPAAPPSWTDWTATGAAAGWACWPASALAAGPAMARAPVLSCAFRMWWPRKRPRGWRCCASRRWCEQRSGGRIQVRGLSRLASCMATTTRWRRCSWARSKCWRPRCPSSGASAFPSSSCLTCRFCLSDVADVRRVTQGPLGQRLLQAPEPPAA